MARAIDADELQELCNRRIQDTWNSGTAPVSWAAAYADFKDDIDSMPTLTPPNEPLTLKELREMDDEPVWCCPKNDSAKGSWMIVGPNGCENITSFAIYDDYGTGWLAYRRPPEVSP